MGDFWTARNEFALEVFGRIRDPIRSVGRDEQHVFLKVFVEALPASLVKMCYNPARVTTEKEWLI